MINATLTLLFVLLEPLFGDQIDQKVETTRKEELLVN